MASTLKKSANGSATSIVATTCVLPRLGIIANSASSSTPNATEGSQRRSTATS